MHSIIKQFVSTANRYPNQQALITEQGAYTYKYLNEYSDELAASISANGWKADHYVVVLFERGFAAVAAVLAALKTGAVVIPMDPEDPPARIKAAIIIGSKDGACKVLSLKKWRNLLEPHEVNFIAIDDEKKQSFCPSQTLPKTPDEESSAAFIFLTSGSGGIPKGILISNRAVLAGVEWAKKTLELSEKDVHCFKSSLGYISILRHLFWPLLTGGSSVVVEPKRHRETDHIGRLTEKYKISVLIFFPFLLETFLNFSHRFNFSSLRYVITGGGPVTRELRELFFAKTRATLINTYALTEANFCCVHQCSVEDPGPLTPIGNPIDGVDLLLLSESNEIVNGDGEGQILVKGLTLFSGYCGAQGKMTWIDTTEPGCEGYFGTGDYAFRKNSILFFSGRRDRRIKLRGHLLDLSEIELELAKHGFVENVAVHVIPNGQQTQHLSVFVEPKAGVLPDLNKITAVLKNVVFSSIGFKIKEVPHLPRLFNGKIDYALLSETGTDNTWLFCDHAANLSRFPDIISACVCKTLEIPPSGLAHSFFECCGDSLKLCELVVKIEKEFNITVESMAILKALSMTEFINDLSLKLRSQSTLANK